MKINSFKRCDSVGFRYRKIIKALENYPDDREVSLIFVDTAGIRELNKKFRNIDAPTDVLSFEADTPGYAGDIFICVSKVREQAENFGHSPEKEFAFLLCHGILHLNGYDHGNEEEERIMFEKQDEILAKMQKAIK